MPPSPLPCAPSGLSLRRCASLPQRLHLASRALHPRAHLTLPTHPLRPRVPDRPARALLVSGQARRSAARLHSQPHSPAQRRCASQWCGALRRRALPRCRPHYAATAPPRVAHRRPKSAAGVRELHRCPGACGGAAASAYAARPQLLRSRGLGRPDRPGGRGRRQQPHARLALGVAVDLKHLHAAPRRLARHARTRFAARRAPNTAHNAGPAPAGHPRQPSAAGGRARQVAACMS